VGLISGNLPRTCFADMLAAASMLQPESFLFIVLTIAFPCLALLCVFDLCSSPFLRRRPPFKLSTMFNGLVKKVIKPNGQKPTEFENKVGTELFNLEMSATEIKSELRDL
jgi:hypothetical protein